MPVRMIILFPRVLLPGTGRAGLRNSVSWSCALTGWGTNWRSRAFHDVCWKNIGDSGFPDRIPWIKAAAAGRPYMDLTRVGIYGGSAGGQSALRAVLAHSDFYHVAVADCGCHDNRMDKIWWNEAWMGWPVGPHYEEQSNVTNAHRLQGDLLLIVGELDRNVPPASTLQVVDALIKADKDFDLLVMPGVGHGAAETPYGQRRRQDFFVRQLLGVEPRRGEAMPESPACTTIASLSEGRRRAPRERAIFDSGLESPLFALSFRSGASHAPRLRGFWP